MAKNLAFPAKWNGTCKRCGKEFTAGQYINLFNRPVPKSTYHWDCSNPDAVPSDYNTSTTETEDESTPTPTPTEKPKTQDTPSVEEAIRELVKTIAPKPATVDTESIREQVNAIAKEELAKLIVPQNITIKIDNREIKVDGIKPHKSFAELLYLAANREYTYLYGDPGWGKSQAIHEVAKALNLPFGFTSLTLQTSDTRLMGFRDAHGNYHPTPIRTLFETGGIFCVDEVDRANGNTLTALNNMLANGHGQFPDGIITRHPDFWCAATGNTVGTGANLQFPDCRPLDSAFRDRFFFFEWGEDNAFERTIALSINSNAGNWVDWIQKVRAFVKTNNLKLVVSPRASYKGALHLRQGYLPLERIAEGVLWRGAARETVTRILAANPYPTYSNGGAQ